MVPIIYSARLNLRFTSLVPAVRHCLPRGPEVTARGIWLATMTLKLLKFVCPVGPPARSCTDPIFRLVRTRVLALQLWVLVGRFSVRPVLTALVLELRSRQVRNPSSNLTLWFLRFPMHRTTLWFLVVMVCTVVLSRGL